MVVSMLFEQGFDNFWLRILFIVIGVASIAGVSEYSHITVWFFVYCTIQRTALSLLIEMVPGFPTWTFMIGLIIEIFLAIILLIIELPDGPLCFLRAGILLYESWLCSSILARISYNTIAQSPVISGIVILIIILGTIMYLIGER